MKGNLKNILLFFSILMLCLTVPAQNNIMDSLKLVLKNAKQDTTRCDILNQIIEEESDDKIWPVYNEQLREIAEKNLATKNNPLYKIFLKYLSSALNNIGFLNYNRGDIPKAIDYMGRSMKLEVELNDRKGVAESLNNIAVVKYFQGDIDRALEDHHKSLKIREIGRAHV